MLRIISSVRSPEGAATSMSMPPPRTIQCSAVVENAARSCGSIPPIVQENRPDAILARPGVERHLARIGSGGRERREAGSDAQDPLGRRPAAVGSRAPGQRRPRPPGPDELVARAASLASWATSGLTRVINATGVILHTGLGRAPIAERAARAAARAAAGYGDLEVARETGSRSPRSARAELLLTSITGAEAALVVNNGAAAL